MDAMYDGGNVLLPDLRGLTDRELGDLKERTEKEWARRVRDAFYFQRSYDIDSKLVAEAMLRHGSWGKRA